MLQPTKQTLPTQLIFGINRLELSSAGGGELEENTTASKAVVDLGVGVESVVNTATLLLVKDDLEGLGAVLLGAETLADDLDGVDEVGQDGIVDSSQSARTGALLGLGVARAGGALGLGEDAAGSEDQDVAVGELLLELTSEAATQHGQYVQCKMDRVFLFNLPLLDAVEALQGWDGDKDDNSLLAVANLDLFQTQSQHASSWMTMHSMDRFPSYSTISYGSLDCFMSGRAKPNGSPSV